MSKEFKTISGFSSYSISLDGEVKNNSTSIIKKQQKNKYGYLMTTLISDEKQTKKMFIHRLMLLAYNYNENHANLKVNHIDGDKLNNSLENLEWCTSKENTHHAIKTGLYSDDRDAIKDETVIAIRKEFVPGQKGNRLILMKKYSVKKSMFYYIINDQFRTDLTLTKELNPYFNGSITTAATMGRKLTKENDVEIFKLREKGETLASIAKKYNVSPQAISSILKKTKNI